MQSAKRILLIITVGLLFMACTNPEVPGISAAKPITFLSGITMVSVPAGTFQRDATPTNKSTVSAFWISAHEVTRAQWKAVMGSANDPSYNFATISDSDPVQTVSFYHCIAYCNKLSLAEGLTPVYSVAGVDFNTLKYADVPIIVSSGGPPADDPTWSAVTATWSNTGYRLPTEMEWMWAAMGASSDSQLGAMVGGVNVSGYAKTFAGSNGSNAIGDYAWYNVNSLGKTHPVASTGTTGYANELGLYDMSGNVRERCWDRWTFSVAYPTGLLNDYTGALTGTGRILRGGCKTYDALTCALATRGCHYEAFQSDDLGFRVVRR